MTFQKKVLSYIALLFALTLLVTSGLMTAIVGVHDARIQLNNNYYHQMILAERAQSLLSVQMSLIPSFVMNKTTSEVSRFRVAHDRFRATLAELRSELTDPDEIQELNSLIDLDASTLALAEKGIQMRLSGESLQAVNDYFKANTYTKTEKLGAGLNHLLDIKTAELSLARERLEASESRTLIIMIFTAITVVLLFFLVATLLWREVCNQTRELQLRERLLAQQEHLATARKEVIEVVSHDLKSPLATLFMNLQMTKEDVEAGDFTQRQTLDSLSMALRSVKTMNDLVGQLLDHAKIESGSFVGETSVLDPAELLEQHLVQVRLLARERDVAVETHFDSQIPNLLFDETRFLQVISNLTSNALKFVNPGGTIAIAARVLTSSRQFVISVRNSGAQLREDELEHIFERYWQVRKTAKQGTGLGLAIVKGIMEAYGGSVSARNAEPSGVEFILSFKVSDANLSLRSIKAEPLPEDLFS